MRIVLLKEDFAFKEFMSNETVRKFFLAATLDVPVESIRSVRLMNTFLLRNWRKQKEGILDVKIEFNDRTKVNIEMQVDDKKTGKNEICFICPRCIVRICGGAKIMGNFVAVSGSVFWILT